MRSTYFRTLSSMVKKDKQRLYIALYPRHSAHNSGSCDAYHFALIVGPQTASRSDTGTRYHTAHTSSRFSRKASIHAFAYEENELPYTAGADMIVRITVAKVLDINLVESVLRSMPAPNECHGETCYSWVRRAFEALHEESGCLKSYLRSSDWKEVERTTREFCKVKRRRHIAQQSQALESISTWNFWEHRETTT